MEIVGDWGWSLLAYGFRRRSFEGKIVHEGMCNCLFVSFALPRELMPWRVWRRLISVGPDENLGSCLLFRERFSVFFSSLFFERVIIIVNNYVFMFSFVLIGVLFSFCFRFYYSFSFCCPTA